MILSTTGNMTISGTLTQNSDERIKKNIRDLDDAEALNTLRLLKPVVYEYIDPEGRGYDAETTHEVIGFIAQEVSNVLPHATMTRTDVIPSMMCDGQLIEPDVLQTPTKILPFSENARVRIHWIDQETGRKNADIVTCTEIINPITFRFSSNNSSSNISNPTVFVHGHEVDDFHTLKKDVIFTVVAAATQELDRQLQDARSEIVDLKAQVASQTELITSMESRLAALES